MSKKAEILLVEDDPSIIKVLNFYLKKSGYNLKVAGNGEEALLFMEQELPDLIISDVMMPKMNGIQFREEILKNEELKLIPFVFLTARGSKDEKIDGLNLQVDDYITKPFEMDLLVARLNSILERHNTLNKLLL